MECFALVFTPLIPISPLFRRAVRPLCHNLIF